MFYILHQVTKCLNIARVLADSLLLSLNFKFVTTVTKITNNDSIQNVPFHVLRNTYCKFPPHLSNRFTVE